MSIKTVLSGSFLDFPYWIILLLLISCMFIFETEFYEAQARHSVSEDVAQGRHCISEDVAPSRHNV